MGIYLDNAATTPLDERVFNTMYPYLLENFGNASSSHKLGRHAKLAIDNARKTIAEILQARPNEIYFTSSATEADNTAIRSPLNALEITHVITSKLEHFAVLNTLRHLEAGGFIQLSYVNNDEYGNIDLNHLEHLLASYNRTLVSLMHGNNEIGNLNDINLIGDICKKYSAVFHSDTVQTIGHYRLDVQRSNIHFLVASAHKFHGPKGVGFLYARDTLRLSPLLFGGGQERNMRAGTENVPGIVGMAKALELANENHVPYKKHISYLKHRMIHSLKERIPGIQFNGNSANDDESLFTVLSVSLASSELTDNILSALDNKDIAASGGSACTSGSKASHVLSALNADPTRSTIRFSFSRFNTIEQIDFVVDTLSGLLHGATKTHKIIHDFASE